MSKCLHTLGQGTFVSGKTSQHGKLVQGRQKQDQTHVRRGALTWPQNNMETK